MSAFRIAIRKSTQLGRNSDGDLPVSRSIRCQLIWPFHSEKPGEPPARLDRLDWPVTFQRLAHEDGRLSGFPSLRVELFKGQEERLVRVVGKRSDILRVLRGPNLETNDRTSSSG